ncbi:ABC transporter ATP-binding protein [Chloroflexota bacterium]
MKHVNTFKLIVYFFRPYKLQIVLLFALSAIVGSLEAANVAAIFPILTSAFDIGSEEGNVVLSFLREIANLLPIGDEFAAYCVVFLIIALLTFIAHLITINVGAKIGTRLVERTQIELFNKLVRADYQYFIDHKQGELIYNVATAPRNLINLINSVTNIVSNAILSISVIILLFTLSWEGTIIVLVIGLGYHFFTRYLGRRVSYISGKFEMKALKLCNVILNETFGGIKHVKVYLAEENWILKFGDAMKRHWSYYRRRVIWQQIPSHLLMLILYVSIGLTALIIKVTSPGDIIQLTPLLGTFALAVFRLFPIFGLLGKLTMQISGALPDCEAVYSIRNDNIARLEDGEKELTSFKSQVNFDNVTFTYQQGQTVLKDISITFEKDKTTAIVGSSGIGKTTIINLLLRLFDTSQGEITIDGSDIKEYKLSSWLGKIGLVTQDTYIYNDTIRNNISFHSGKYSDEDIIKAAKYADAHSFVTALPNGYDTLVGDKGTRLSGGQGQRISIARAMIREPEILIFDEATNALDSLSEAAVQKAIEIVSKNRTIIIIAHRLSTIVNADKIIVLGNGTVIEEGNHKELIAKRGSYWQLFQGQSV